MTTPTRRTHKLPPAGPRTESTWLTLLGLATCPAGSIDPDTGDVWVYDPAERIKFRVDPADIDVLVSLGWVDDSRGHDRLDVTPAGVYWCRRFIKLNGGGG